MSPSIPPEVCMGPLQAMQQALDALIAADMAMSQVSPCAQKECFQDQVNELAEAKPLAAPAIHALRQAIAQHHLQPQTLQEPDGYQQRFMDPEEGPSIWVSCTKEDAALLRTRKSREVRDLYAATPLVDAPSSANGSPTTPTAKGLRMTTNHTPGPWPIETDSDDHGGGQWYAVGPAKIWYPYNCSPETAAQARADAVLISAAPEMQAALVMAFRCLQRHGTEAEIEQAHAALVKSGVGVDAKNSNSASSTMWQYMHELFSECSPTSSPDSKP